VKGKGSLQVLNGPKKRSRKRVMEVSQSNEKKRGPDTKKSGGKAWFLMREGTSIEGFDTQKED